MSFKNIKSDVKLIFFKGSKKFKKESQRPTPKQLLFEFDFIV